MSQLTRLQDDFQRYLLRGDPAIESHVIGTSRVPVATRLQIYGGGYGARLTEALQTNFPVLAQLLGEADFEALAAAYIRKVDSTFTSIRYYGDELAEFLGEEPAYAAVPVLPELARWEWAMTETFDAADAQPVGLSAMAGIPAEQWADLRFEWHPSVRRLALEWNVPPIWKALSGDTEPPDPSLSAEAQNWLLWRSALDIFFRSLSVPEAAALEAAASGNCFGEVCDVLCAYCNEDEAAARAAGYLRDWLQAGLITAVTID